MNGDEELDLDEADDDNDADEEEEDEEVDMIEAAIEIPAVPVLRRHIDERYGGSVNLFATTHGFMQSELSRLLNGKRTRISVEEAFRLEAATEGEVSAALFIPR